mmetsp:Transcript_62762/g.177011  ORF Transcript_62762/g.177011 Transcript_62762/m.177011 type:complete len:220 (-) Transcript_62762:807-1466(-)
MMMKAMARIENPNILWCSLVSWSRTLVCDTVSLSRCLSMLSDECADLWTSAMSRCRLSSRLCLSLVSLEATFDRSVSSFLMASNSTPSLCPLFLSSSDFRSAKLFSIAATRLPRESRARDICWRIGWDSTTSLKTMFVRSLIASDSARWSEKDDDSWSTSTFSSSFSAGGCTVGACASSPCWDTSLFSTSRCLSSTKLVLSVGSYGCIRTSPLRDVMPM